MKGIHHLGLSVSNLDASALFFCEQLGWKIVRRVDDYPAIFVSNNHVMITLWQAESSANAFDRRSNIGLHHFALRVDSETELYSIYKKLQSAIDVRIEFEPELLREGPVKHMICYEPSGIRIEFIWMPDLSV